MILFLDFDGVLHPEYEREPMPSEQSFCHLLRLEAILREYPHVEIVITSMWRYEFSITDLRNRFAEDIRHRIIGVTALEEHQNARHLPARREGEILDWLMANDRMGDPWIALDDATWQFQKHKDKLVACVSYVGLNDEAENKLRAMLETNNRGVKD